ncbi:MAG: response regulator [Bacteroidia bacterium]|nr:response regulator [Bacteroidia bacterium]
MNLEIGSFIKSINSIDKVYVNVVKPMRDPGLKSSFMEKDSHILLVEDNIGDMELIKIMLEEIKIPAKSLLLATTLNEAIAYVVSKKNISIIILDLTLPDCYGIDTVKTIRNFFPDNPIIVLTGMHDEKGAMNALREGAQDYLIKGDSDSRTLERVIRFAIERQLNITKLNHASEEIKKSKEEILRKNEQLRSLSAYLQNIRENERTTIAREIHDELGQQLTGLKMDVAWINKRIGHDEPTKMKLNGMLSLIDQTISSVRRISTELRPDILDDLGLIAALEWQNEEYQKRSGIRSIFNNNVEELPFSKNIATGIFRIFQETLTNIARHAHASEIITTFELINKNLVMTIVDDGQGFDQNEVSEKKTLGLIGMKERAFMIGGELYIESAKNKGTTSILVVPLLTQ